MALPCPPFYDIEGICNFRDIGGYSIAGLNTSSVVRRNLNFRCGQPMGLTCNGKLVIKGLGVRKVFDLRSVVEIDETGGNTSIDIEGIGRISTPVFSDQEFNKKTLEKRMQDYLSNDEEVINQSYVDILHHGGPAFREIFLHLRDSPFEPCLIHCAAGKDRTGAAVALILSLAGVESSIIAKEYALSEIGLEAIKPALYKHLAKLPNIQWSRRRPKES